MEVTTLKTLGELKQSGYTSRSIKVELRENLIAHLKNRTTPFTGVIGYENTVLPELERAILSMHNINLLGLRGQAKTRLARAMVYLLDPFIPVVSGSEINDDPLNPISTFAIDLIAEMGDKTPIIWLAREERFFEKLATPDVSVSDLIGDIDPIKAAHLKLSYADPRVLHFGMIPRANRCIFVINEIPDLQARIQVSLFNILQEGDIQIRGFKLRLPIDIQCVFTANPEDYTNRGSIVTPLKDRIGSQILTHYPKDVETAKKITAQEAGALSLPIQVPEIARDLLEQISFEARESDYIDAKSGVSARMSITAFQNLMSTAERRLLLSDESQTTIRLSDFIGIYPAITGKVELVYEGEQEGADFVAQHLLESAIKTLFEERFPKIKKLERKDEEGPYDPLLLWFFESEGFELLEDFSDSMYRDQLDSISPLTDLLKEYAPGVDTETSYFLKELVLWALVAHNKLSKQSFSNGTEFKDLYGSYINGL